MYKITCCRIGKRVYRQNREKKGCFIKSFNTLSEIALFIHNARGSLFFPYILKEFTKKERIILLRKIDAISMRK